jgi:hypothetical protein
MALNWAAHEPLCWFHYVDTFIIWPHGPDRLRASLIT